MTTHLGILGAGQLGLYLCDAARRLGIVTTIVAEDPDMPAVQRADNAIVGALDDPAVVERLLDECDVITFEKEDIPNECLTRLALAEREGRVTVHPSPEALFRIKDKGLQKHWLLREGFPTLPFRVISGVNTDRAALADEFGLPLVQKARCGGYDGLGVQILEDREQLDQLWDVPSVIETFLPGCREIAVLVARGTDGQVASWPTVGMAFDERFNALATVIAPAAIDPALARQAEQLARDIVARLEEVGVFAVELFIDERDTLYVNEISPRVHNSGHLTMEACDASQFEQHVRAITGMSLAGTETVRPAAMVNVLYEDALRERCPATPTRIASDDGTVTVHWYGKPPGRIGRKMGHVTALADSAEEAEQLALKKRATLADGKTSEDDRAA